MKRVSFEVAKALKEAGYPQPLPPDKIWHYNEEGRLYKGEIKGNRIYAPYVMGVWLWLWREKDIRIVAGNLTCFIWQDTEYEVIETAYSDPEEVIIAAIEYLVTNKLIK